MKFQNRLFYEAGTATETGGAAATTEVDKGGEQQQQSEQQNTDTSKDAPKDLPKQIISDEEIKQYGFDSPEALKTFLEKNRESKIPEEVKKEQENIRKASFLKFAAENKNDNDGSPLLNVEDYTKYETLKATSDRDLVFQKHLEEYKAEHPDITDPQDLEDAAQEDFENEYPLNGTDAQKAKAERKLARDAKDIREPFEQKVNSAQEAFKEYTHVQETYPKYEKWIDEAIVRNTPDKLGVVKLKEGENEFEVEIELSKEDREAIAKTFKTHKTFALFTSAEDQKEAQKIIDNKIQGWLFLNKREQITNEVYKVGKGVGTRLGSNIGAENPFALRQGAGAGQDTKGKTLAESNREIEEARAKERQRTG